MIQLQYVSTDKFSNIGQNNRLGLHRSDYMLVSAERAMAQWQKRMGALRHGGGSFPPLAPPLKRFLMKTGCQGTYIKKNMLVSQSNSLIEIELNTISASLQSSVKICMAPKGRKYI
jgi:hypothetical protein